MLFRAMNLNFYDVMKKGICFSTIVSLIFSPYSKCVNIYYCDKAGALSPANSLTVRRISSFSNLLSS